MTKRVNLTETDVEILKEMITNRHGKPGYSDDQIAKEVSDKNMLSANQKVKAQHVSSLRIEMGLKNHRGRHKRSTKTMETHASPKSKKEKTEKPEHPIKSAACAFITLANLIKLSEQAAIAASEVRSTIQQYVVQEKERIGV